MIAAFAQIKLKLDTRPRPELLENSNIAFTHIKVEFTFASPLLLPVTVTFNLFFILGKCRYTLHFYIFVYDIFFF